jgi:hypothetical protein
MEQDWRVLAGIRQSALVTATSFGTIIGLASSSSPSQDWLDEVRPVEGPLSTLRLAALSANKIYQTTLSLAI